MEDRHKIESLEHSFSYWQEQLNGCSPILNFPFDFPRSGNITKFETVELISISNEIFSELRKIGKNEAIGLSSMMLAAFGILIHKYSGDTDINISTHLVDSSQYFLETIDDKSFNPLVIRMKINQEISFQILVKPTDVLIINAFEYQFIAIIKDFKELYIIIDAYYYHKRNFIFVQIVIHIIHIWQWNLLRV